MKKKPNDSAKKSTKLSAPRGSSNKTTPSRSKTSATSSRSSAKPSPRTPPRPQNRDWPNVGQHQLKLDPLTTTEVTVTNTTIYHKQIVAIRLNQTHAINLHTCSDDRLLLAHLFPDDSLTWIHFPYLNIQKPQDIARAIWTANIDWENEFHAGSHGNLPKLAIWQQNDEQGWLKAHHPLGIARLQLEINRTLHNLPRWQNNPQERTKQIQLLLREVKLLQHIDPTFEPTPEILQHLL